MARKRVTFLAHGRKVSFLRGSGSSRKMVRRKMVRRKIVGRKIVGRKMVGNNWEVKLHKFSHEPRFKVEVVFKGHHGKFLKKDTFSTYEGAREFYDSLDTVRDIWLAITCEAKMFVSDFTWTGRGREVPVRAKIPRQTEVVDVKPRNRRRHRLTDKLTHGY